MILGGASRRVSGGVAPLKRCVGAAVRYSFCGWLYVVVAFEGRGLGRCDVCGLAWRLRYFFIVCDACMTHMTSNLLGLNKSILCVARMSGMSSFQYVKVHGGVGRCILCAAGCGQYPMFFFDSVLMMYGHHVYRVSLGKVGVCACWCFT